MQFIAQSDDALFFLAVALFLGALCSGVEFYSMISHSMNISTGVTRCVSAYTYPLQAV